MSFSLWWRGDVACIEAKYKIPLRNYFGGTVLQLYEAVRGDLVQSLIAAKGGVINSTTDLWASDYNAHAYLWYYCATV